MYPAVLAVTLVFIFLEGFQTRRAVDLWEQFDSRISLLDPSSIPAAETRLSAALVWQSVALGYWWLGVGFLIWTILVGSFAVATAVVCFL